MTSTRLVLYESTADYSTVINVSKIRSIINIKFNINSKLYDHHEFRVTLIHQTRKHYFTN
jgi:hypothetical protein